MYANGMLLLSVVLVPFVTAAVAEYLSSPDRVLAQPAITLYCGVILLNNIAWNIILNVCLSAETLLKPNIHVGKVKEQATYVRYGLFLYGFTFTLSFWFPVTAFVIMALSFLVWLVQSITTEEERLAV